MSNVQVQLGGNTVQVQVQSSGFARANAAVTAAAADATAAAASAASAAATLAAAALKANNLSDLASASTARTNLGVAIGTNVQAYSANLDEYAAVNPTAAGLALLDDADASAQRTTLGLGSIATQAASAVAITGGSIAGITDLAVADGGTGASSASAARDNLGLTIGTNVQAYDADLTTWAGITPGTGVAAALAANVGSAGAPVLFNGAGGTPSSLTLTNATGLPVAGITSSTTQALGVGSLELGHASDTTLARSSAGNMTIEGNLVYRAGGTDVPITDGGTGSSTAADARTALAVVGTADLAASTGAALVGSIVTGTGALARTVQTKLRDYVAPADYTGGAQVALAALRDTGDPAFSGAMFVPNSSTNLSAPISLPVSFARVYGGGGGTFLQAPGDHVFSASGATAVQSSFSGFRTYSGADAFHIWPAGEVANLNFTDIVCSQFNDDAFSFSDGLTSSKFLRCAVDSTLGARGIYCAAGINNDVRITDSDFTNLTGPAIKVVGLTQLWRLNGLRVEENGQTGQHVFDLEGATAVNITGSWFEDHHEYLLKLTGDSDDGVTFDGCVDAGAKDGAGLKASLFDVGTNRVLFGTNTFTNSTAAPSRCFIWGVNSGLTTDSSTVHARALNASEYVVSKKRSFANSGALAFDFLTVTRPDATDVGTNQQVIFVEMTIAIGGYVSGGIPRAGVWKARFTISTIGNTITDPDSYVVVDTGVGNIGAVTVAIAKSAAPTSTAITMKMTIANLDTSYDDYCQYDLRILNMSSTDARRAVISVL